MNAVKFSPKPNVTLKQFIEYCDYLSNLTEDKRAIINNYLITCELNTILDLFAILAIEAPHIISDSAMVEVSNKILDRAEGEEYYFKTPLLKLLKTGEKINDSLLLNPTELDQFFALFSDDEDDFFDEDEKLHIAFIIEDFFNGKATDRHIDFIHLIFARLNIRNIHGRELSSFVIKNYFIYKSLDFIIDNDFFDNSPLEWFVELYSETFKDFIL